MQRGGEKIEAEHTSYLFERAWLEGDERVGGNWPGTWGQWGSFLSMSLPCFPSDSVDGDRDPSRAGLFISVGRKSTRCKAFFHAHTH